MYLAVVLSAVLLAAPPLLAARKGFTTKLTKKISEPAGQPPSGLERVTFGKLHGWLAKPAAPEKVKVPAVVFLAGGFPGGGYDPRGRPFSDAGAVVLYPTYRGTDGNPGAQESFFGEVDDVLAAVAFVMAQEVVDPQRVYLVGHGTGGTLALLVAASTDKLAGVVAFGPAAEACTYGANELRFDVSKTKECELRAPMKHLTARNVRVWIIEGESGRTADLRALQEAGAKSTFITVANANHFDVVEPVGALAAQELMKDELRLTATAVQAAFDGPPVTVSDPSGWSVPLPKGFRFMPGGEEPMYRRGNLVVMFQRLEGPIARDCASFQAAAKGFTTFKEKWGKHDICGLRMALREGSTELVSLALQLPFSPRALSLQLVGPVGREAELVALGREILPNVKGPTTWK